jgi:predicted transcriptional regulator
MPLIAMTVQGESPLINAKAPEFTLEDQYDRSFAIRQFAGRVVVLIASDRNGKVQNPPWTKALRERYGDGIALQGVADLRGVPFFLKGTIRKDLRKEYADSVLLDWKGDLFTACGLMKEVSNVIVIDRSGVIRFVHAGPADTDAVPRVFKEIDKLGR